MSKYTVWVVGLFFLTLSLLGLGASVRLSKQVNDLQMKMKFLEASTRDDLDKIVNVNVECRKKLQELDGLLKNISQLSCKPRF